MSVMVCNCYWIYQTIYSLSVLIIDGLYMYLRGNFLYQTFFLNILFLLINLGYS